MLLSDRGEFCSECTPSCDASTNSLARSGASSFNPILFVFIVGLVGAGGSCDDRAPRVSDEDA